MTNQSLVKARRSSGATESVFQSHDDLVDVAVPGGPRDALSIDAVLGLLPALPNWPPQGRTCDSASVLAGAKVILVWLAGHPGAGWQDRWLTSGADEGVNWLDALAESNNPRGLSTFRGVLVQALSRLLLCRIVFPSYQFLAAYRSFNLYSHVRQVFRPDLSSVVEERARVLAGVTEQRNQALVRSARPCCTPAATSTS